MSQGYHILAMALFLPALLTEPQLLALSLAIAAAALIVAEVLRVGCVPVAGPCIHSFMTAFIDSRDQGLLLISHFSLLLGMAVPLWLALPVVTHQEGDGLRNPNAAGRLAQSSQGGGTMAGPGRSWWQTADQPVPAFAFAGILILGVADSAASAVGRRYGRHKILQTHKSLEGTLGGVVCTMLGWVAVAVLLNLTAGRPLLCLGNGVAGASWSTVSAAVVGSCLLEAVTTQLDNIFLPLHHCALLSLN